MSQSVRSGIDFHFGSCSEKFKKLLLDNSVKYFPTVSSVISKGVTVFLVLPGGQYSKVWGNRGKTGAV